MSVEDSSVTILIGGEAGQGLVTVGQLLCKSLIRAGYLICVQQDYESRIRGGHNTFMVRAGLDPKAPKETIDILVALNEETIKLHKPQLAPGALVLSDSRIQVQDTEELGVPYQDLAPQTIFENVAALGVLAQVLKLKRRAVEEVITESFKKKGPEVIDKNLKVLDDAWKWMTGKSRDFRGLPEVAESGRRLLMNGNECIVLGALAAGCNFCSFYPMTPATTVALSFIEKGAPMGVVVEQAEDELAAMNMALGASFAGARAMVPTSGGGMALMAEGLSLAGMLEQPVVLVLGMRPGPATGLPTRTGQEDLYFALHAGHGEFPKALLAPGTPEECFRLGHKAFDLAERFQSPVVLFTDQYIADSYRAVEPFDFDSLPEVASPLLGVDEPGQYKRYKITESGVSPRLIPGFSEGLVVADSDEHDEDGHITEDLVLRTDMVKKRLRKFFGLLEHVTPPTCIGPEDAELLLACWGSTRGAVEEAAEILSSSGRRTAVMHFSQVWPLDPSQFMDRLERAGTAVMVEGNATGQLASLIRRETGFTFGRKVLRFDGLPFTASYILDALAG